MEFDNILQIILVVLAATISMIFSCLFLLRRKDMEIEKITIMLNNFRRREKTLSEQENTVRLLREELLRANREADELRTGLRQRALLNPYGVPTLPDMSAVAQEMYDKTDLVIKQRLHYILLRLQDPGHITEGDLRSQFRISPRTIGRDFRLFEKLWPAVIEYNDTDDVYRNPSLYKRHD